MTGCINKDLFCQREEELQRVADTAAEEPIEEEEDDHFYSDAATTEHGAGT